MSCAGLCFVFGGEDIEYIPAIVCVGGVGKYYCLLTAIVMDSMYK